MKPGRARIKPLYTGVRVRDLDRSIRFYRALGFRQRLRARTGLGEFAQLEHAESRFTIELNRFRKGTSIWEPYRKGVEMDHFGFWVDDVDAWVRKLCRVGGAVRLQPFDSSIVIPPRRPFQGRAAYVADPDGIWVELMGPLKVRGHGRRPTREAR